MSAEPSGDLKAGSPTNVPAPGPVFPHLQQHQQPIIIENSKVDYDAEAKKLEEKANRFLAKQTHPVIIPSFAAWFEFDDIHELEKRALPSFFNESSRFKTPKAYRDVRNFMINTYRLSPYEYLTVTAIRRNIAMDVASVLKIHQFLEKWGLINYQIDPKSKPSLVGPSFTGHFQVILDTPQGLKPFVPPVAVQPEPEMPEKTPTTEIETPAVNVDEVKEEKKLEFKQPEPFPVNLSLRKNIYDTLHDFNALRQLNLQTRQINKQYICFSCGNDATTIRYHNLRAKNVNICSRCFQEGHFGANFHAADFIKLTENATISNSSWNDQELLLLLEGLEMYEDKWDKIVDHIGGSKTVEMCIEKFLCLPIEDKFINEIIPKKPSFKVQSSKSVQTTEAVDATIKSLLKGLSNEVLKEHVPKSAKQISQKYIQEAQVVIQDLVEATLDKLDLKFQKIDQLEISMKEERDTYVKETERLVNERLKLSKQIKDINSHLAELQISKRIVLSSDQKSETDIALMEKADAEADVGLKKNESIDVQSISKTEPQLYKKWSL